MSALRAFLVALGCPQHEKALVGLGFDDVTTFAAFSESDVNVMQEMLTTAGVPLGHEIKIIRAVRGCQDYMYEQKAGSSPLKFDYGKQMPLLKILRDEVSSPKKDMAELRQQAAERQLLSIDGMPRGRAAEGV